MHQQQEAEGYSCRSKELSVAAAAADSRNPRLLLMLKLSKTAMDNITHAAAAVTA